MNEIIQSVRGMYDYMPKDTIIWRYVENVFERIMNSYGYQEIRFPIVEFTNLFTHSVGGSTDVVEKEMYSFIDHNGNSLTLRPEGTSGCVRAGIEKRLLYHCDQRLWYYGPMFRYERPQRGRCRQFHQFSAEAFGYVGPDIEVELILMTARCWKELGISQYLFLELNSIGSCESRSNYCKKLINFLEKHLCYLDNSALRRLYSNPMRILDTKNAVIRKLLLDAPVISNFLDNESRVHFSKLCELLDFFNISYIVNPYLVRGLDYYNRTVFEWVTDNLGVKKTICAGGRYDELVYQLGGYKTPAVGFSIGMERVILLLKTINTIKFTQSFIVKIDIYMICIGANSYKNSVFLSERIRSVFPSIRLMVHHGNHSFYKQWSRAKHRNARIIFIMKEGNINDKTIILKDLKYGAEEILHWNDVIDRIRYLFHL